MTTLTRSLNAVARSRNSIATAAVVQGVLAAGLNLATGTHVGTLMVLPLAVATGIGLAIVKAR